MRKSILILALITVLLLTGCGFSEVNKTSENNTEVVELNDSDVEKIAEGMNMGDVISLIGACHYDFQSSSYPFVYSWQMSGDRMLTIVFKVEGCETQNEYSEKFKSQVLSDDSQTDSSQEQEISVMTEEEMKAAKEWLHTNAIAVSAYVAEQKEKTVLFGE